MLANGVWAEETVISGSKHLRASVQPSSAPFLSYMYLDGFSVEEERWKQQESLSDCMEDKMPWAVAQLHYILEEQELRLCGVHALRFQGDLNALNKQGNHD